MAAQSIAELFEEAAKAKTREEKAKILAKDQSGTVATILRVGLDPSIVFDLPPGVPPYKKNELVDIEGAIYREVRKFKHFIKGSNVNPIKKETLFLEMLENLNPKDAELVCLAKDKKSLGKGITVGVANKAFPGLINEKK